MAFHKQINSTEKIIYNVNKHITPHGLPQLKKSEFCVIGYK